MAAVALIVFNQGGPGTAGEAFEGTLAGGIVTATNDDDTDVASYEFTMLDVPPDSAVPTGVITSGAPPSTASFTPDVAGSYRVRLKVTAVSTGLTDTDIRIFGVRNARGIIIPPYQRNPDPLPLLGTGIAGEKPDEQNYGGQARGWAGDRASGQLEQFMTTYDDLPYKQISGTPYTAIPGEAPCYLVDMTAVGSDAVLNLPVSGWRANQRIRIHAYGNSAYTLTVNPGVCPIDGYSTIVMRAPNTLDIVRIGATEWFMTGAKTDVYERSLVAGVETVGVTGFQAIGGTVALNPSDFPNGTITWKAVISTTNAADAAEIRLYNLTLGAAVSGSTLSTTSLTPVEVDSSVTLASGSNLYEAQLRLQTTGVPNQATCSQAQVAIAWLQP